MKSFSVTYEINTPDEMEDEDFDFECTSEDGYVSEECSLSEAIDLLGNAEEANSYPLSLKNPPRWFTNTKYREDYCTGEVESRSLHLPRNITPSSAMRVARLLGVTR